MTTQRPPNRDTRIEMPHIANVTQGCSPVDRSLDILKWSRDSDFILVCPFLEANNGHPRQCHRTGLAVYTYTYLSS